MTLTRCPTCAAAVPAGAYCAVCGGPLQAAPARVAVAPDAAQKADLTDDFSTATTVLPRQPTVQDAPDDLPPIADLPVEVHPAPQRRHFGVRLGQSAWVTAVLLVLGVGFVAFGTGENHTLTGQLTVSDTDFTGTVGYSCTSPSGYDDISEGAQVMVEDEQGGTLATGTLGPGIWDGQGCVFALSVKNVGKARYYKITAGRSSRDGPRYSHQEMVDNHWAPQLVLGD
jgi:hypothetical protein